MIGFETGEIVNHAAVSIADILVMHPDIIILDEPAAALDPKHTAMVNHIVDELTAQGITVLMSTHDVNYAFAWADEIFFIQGWKGSEIRNAGGGLYRHLCPQGDQPHPACRAGAVRQPLRKRNFKERMENPQESEGTGSLYQRTVI